MRIIDGNGKVCRCYEQQWGGYSKKLKMELPYKPAIPLLGTHTHHSTDEWIDKMW
jgi:hypothetical protein